MSSISIRREGSFSSTVLIQFISRSVLPNTVNSNTPSCSSVLTIINGSPCKESKTLVLELVLDNVFWVKTFNNLASLETI